MIAKLLVTFNRHVRNAQFEIIRRPILELGSAFGSFVADEKVRKQHTGRIGRNEDQNVPKTVQIRKVHPRPRIAKHPIVDPAYDGKHQDGGVADTQPVDPFILHATKNKCKIRVKGNPDL